MKPFVFQFTVPEKTIEKPLADADGAPITIGAILSHEDGNTRGVVTWIGFPDDEQSKWNAPPMSRIGDMQVDQGSGISRVSNQYEKWRHIPREQTTYRERLRSWMVRPFHYDEPDEDIEECNRVSKAEALACDGIMALLPNDPVDLDYGEWPDRIEAALRYLTAHLEDLENREAHPPTVGCGEGSNHETT